MRGAVRSGCGRPRRGARPSSRRGRPASARPSTSTASPATQTSLTSRDPPAHTRLDSSWASSDGSVNTASSRSTCTRSAQRPGSSAPRSVRPIAAAPSRVAMSSSSAPSAPPRRRCSPGPGGQRASPGPTCRDRRQTPGRPSPIRRARPRDAARSPGRSRPRAWRSSQDSARPPSRDRPKGRCRTPTAGRRDAASTRPPNMPTASSRAGTDPCDARCGRSSSAASATWMCTSAPLARACSPTDASASGGSVYAAWGP